MHDETTDAATHAGVAKQAAIRLIAGWILLPAFFLGTAGTWSWWEAWVYCAELLVPMTIFAVWMTRRDPAAVARRLKARETEAAQRRIQAWGGVAFIVLLTVPGLDHRFGWSEPPLAVRLGGLAIVLLSYLAILWVFVTNRWAARTVETFEGQTVVSTGPYAIVRHPMYSAMLLLSLATPLALGSWWAVLPMLAIVPMIVLRIANEEEVLLRELTGYAAYRAQVRWRLLPHLW